MGVVVVSCGLHVIIGVCVIGATVHACARMYGNHCCPCWQYVCIREHVRSRVRMVAHVWM